MERGLSTLLSQYRALTAPNKVRYEQIKLLYRQMPIAVLSECIAAALFCAGLWPVGNHQWLVSWFVFVVIASCCWKVLLSIYYKNYPKSLPEHLWLMLLILGVLASGISWGIAGSLLIPDEHGVYQVYVMIMFFGVFAAANALYSSFRFVYVIFLIPAFLPFSYWLFTHDEQFIFLGYCSLVYVFLMLAISYYTNNLLVNSLQLRFQLVDLDSNNHVLERKIQEHTSSLINVLAVTESILECTADGILVVDSNRRIDYYNQHFLNMWQINKDKTSLYHDTVLQQYFLEQLQNPQDFLARTERIYCAMEKESYDELYLKDGTIMERYSKPHRLDQLIVGRVWSFRDITARKKLSYQVNHDYLTGLPNRIFLYERVGQILSYIQSSNKTLVAMFLDIDNFKEINDTFGHDAGDLVLKEVALRLSQCMRHRDMIARLGGDEFVLLFIVNNKHNIDSVAQKILKYIAKPIPLPHRSIHVTVSIGISIYPEDSDTAEDLFKKADLAMYAAKKNGRNNFKFS